MTVTQISDGRGVKKHIHIDGEYSFTVDGEYLLKCGIFVGEELTEEKIEEIKAGYEKHCAQKRALGLLSRRSHSAKELRTKLMTRTSAENADAVVEKMKDYGYVDDERFAEIYADELWERKLFSQSRIRRELILKGIDRDTADSVVEKYECDEKERIREIIESRYYLKLSTEKGRRSLFALLVRLGYSYGDIRASFGEYDDLYEE